MSEKNGAVDSGTLTEDLKLYGLQHPVFKKILESTASAIVKAAQTAPNEATISSTFEIQLATALDKIGISYAPVKEESLSIGAKRLKGRLDSRVGDVIIEFKQPSTFDTQKKRSVAVAQALAYCRSLFAGSGRTVLAYVTDGIQVIPLRIDERGETEGALRGVDGEFLLNYSTEVVGTQRRALSAKNLVERFSDQSPVTRSLARALFEALDPDVSVGRTQMLFEEWQLLFKLAHDDTSKQKALEDRRNALQRVVGVPLPSDRLAHQYRALFAIQTAYSIVLKLIGMNVLHGATEFGGSMNLSMVVDSGREPVQRFLAMMEDGSDLRNHGVENLLEGDFFSWYAQADQFTTSLWQAITPVIREIIDFEGLPAFHGNQAAAQDLFKDLYMHMIPSEVRHSLGEYYTPSWLADHTIGAALDASGASESHHWRLLDPTCGSGTFLTMAMRRVLSESRAQSSHEKLQEVLNRVVGIDLNPLAVLTARMNYFVNIAPLLSSETSFHIPVYLGDASVAPLPANLDGVECLTSSIRTLKGTLDVTLPRSALKDITQFTTVMARVETYTKAQNEGLIVDALLALVTPEERTERVATSIGQLAAELVELERREWNGIWPRIIADFLTTAALGKFDVVAGNPPWIDWKNLPENYRRTLVNMCVERGIFSGDGVTGGINLNVCALITLTAAENWLAPGGALAFLMPDTLLVQQSYEGFRRLKLIRNGDALHLAKLADWGRAGHPFYPVQQRFNTYVFTDSKPSSWPGVAVDVLVKKRGMPLPPPTLEVAFSDLNAELFHVEPSWAEPVHEGKTYFSRGRDSAEVRSFSRVAGESAYRGREGIEFYPQELLLFEFVSQGSRPGLAWFKNYQGRNSKHKVPEMTLELETKFMRPLIKGPMVERYAVEQAKYFVPFYYDPEVGEGRSPLSLDRILRESPKLGALLVSNRGLFEAQTDYNKRIIGNKHATEYYALARVGSYSHAPIHVVYRDNTKWGAAVVGPVEAPWGDPVLPVFQNHAVTISEGPDGTFIDEDEAHFIAAVLNSTLVSTFITRSSENRSFKIRIPVAIPVYDSANELHAKLSAASKQAHDLTAKERGPVLSEIDEIVSSLFPLSGIGDA